ncbi:DUF3108 domain-containing protein [Paraburkholderia caballeronis]|uniref:DUF3108 domain-containing protein n=1 Tax=Paraburkholderia caballeronis TaxID=416943 RepID=A0A1H7HQ30_9BURK|nr:DUF3108 domain-containing protein [Paraburkholderia caballeronis]PXW29416.1 uncharacterized protein DUF3108 [Paraburkholderia caballeronis]PXX04675.1 uncharacterized protein DUF3108 [Paraburkholderia caballeronis]RAK05736.1 uncharacterized protein DUF3108 [Paraburkholderia caballeronis]SED01373.1 Protein of unknown function [Paraburkholderia caballeronis]SEK52284.1 Protein of unknown function [Paraburkholderia caballeronis]
MSSSASPSRATRTSTPRSRRFSASRWAAVFVAVTALHWLAAQWIERHRDMPQPTTPTHVPVQVALLKPQQIERSASPPAAAARTARHAETPKHPEERRHALTAIAHEPQPKVSAQAASSEPAAAEPASAASAPAASGNGNAQTTGKGGTGNTPSAPPGPASHGVKFSVPPSGDLQYDTFYNGMRNQPGTIHWSSDGQHYEMVVSVPLPFVGTFSWTSRGRVDAFGLAPDQYVEKRGRRPEDVTVFNRDGRQIVFTRTPNSLALPDGAQDRFSMVMQLASLVRGDPDAYKPGVTREFFVADNDSGETWPITTIGDESVSTDQGFVDARHFMRLPRHEGDRRRIDVWLAPSLGWLPVRLVQTEPNGTQVELVWRGPLTVPASSAKDGAVAPETGNANSAAPASDAAGNAGSGIATAPAEPAGPSTPQPPSPNNGLAAPAGNAANAAANAAPSIPQPDDTAAPAPAKP